MEVILVLLTLLTIIIAAIASRFTDNSNPYPFVKKETLYSPAERAFLRLIEQAVGHEYKIMTRVRLADIIETKMTVSTRAKRAATLKASVKKIDFILCHKETMSIIAAIDLVNNASTSGHKARGDWFVTGALESAGIPHIRIKVRTGYKSQEIRDCIYYKLGKIERQKRPSSLPKPIVKPSILKPSLPVPSASTALAQI